MCELSIAVFKEFLRNFLLSSELCGKVLEGWWKLEMIGFNMYLDNIIILILPVQSMQHVRKSCWKVYTYNI